MAYHSNRWQRRHSKAITNPSFKAGSLSTNNVALLWIEHTALCLHQPLPSKVTDRIGGSSEASIAACFKRLTGESLDITMIGWR